jgi:hypothetical protein
VHSTTYGPPNRSGSIKVNHIFSTRTMCEFRGLSLGEIGVGQPIHARSRCSPLKGGPSLDAHLSLHINLDQLEDEATP